MGYVHIPDMGLPGLDQFTKTYFPQLKKQAIIIDVRGNGGGFVSPLVIERLRRARGISRILVATRMPGSAMMSSWVTSLTPGPLELPAAGSRQARITRLPGG